MIDKQNISIEWIDKVSNQNQNVDKILVEKVIRALLLLEGLVKQKLDFVFKGGTALMLHLESTKRLSIDIDIIISQEISDLDDILQKIVDEQGFIRKELMNRDTKSKIKKEHYKFFYTPIHNTYKDNSEDNVLLDILIEKINYTKTIELPIKSAFVPMHDDPLLVKVPCLEDLLGDKLTAFAPNTTGIPYSKSGKSMSMEIIKQLYDIGNLFDKVENIQIIKDTFKIFAKTELEYRNEKNLKEQDVLDDIYQTSLCIGTRGADGNGNFEDLEKGIHRIKNYIFSENYHIERAIIHASIAAYLSTLIRYNADEIEKFSDSLDLKTWEIIKPMNTKLNKLKKSNPEAFFYWYKIYKLTTQE